MAFGPGLVDDSVINALQVLGVVASKLGFDSDAASLRTSGSSTVQALTVAWIASPGDGQIVEPARADESIEFATELVHPDQPQIGQQLRAFAHLYRYFTSLNCPTSLWRAPKWRVDGLSEQFRSQPVASLDEFYRRIDGNRASI